MNGIGKEAIYLFYGILKNLHRLEKEKVVCNMICIAQKLIVMNSYVV